MPRSARGARSAGWPRRPRRGPPPRAGRATGPAPVAVHDDGHVARQALAPGPASSQVAVRHRHLPGRHRPAARSPRPRGPPAPWPCRRDRPRRSSGRSPSGGLQLAMAPRRRRSRRRARGLDVVDAPRGGGCGSRPWPPPCACGRSFTISLRRSSVSGGMFRRTTVPSTFGVRPMSLLRMAFSMAPSTPRSQGWMTIWWPPAR